MLLQDQLHRTIQLDSKPSRIISLVPSITYALYQLDLANEVVGITRFCSKPSEWRKQKKIIGGTKDVKIDSIATLQPDIIFASKEENTKEIVEALQQIASVYVSDVTNLSSNDELLTHLGLIFDKKSQAGNLVDAIKHKADLLQATIQNNIKSAVYLIWKDPFMTVGGDTFINEMMQISGFSNLLRNQSRYPQLSIEDLKQLNPEVLFLSSEPYPFKKKHKLELQNALPDTKILLVQGEPFTWFGTYPIQGLEYLLHLRKEL